MRKKKDADLDVADSVWCVHGHPVLLQRSKSSTKGNGNKCNQLEKIVSASPNKPDKQMTISCFPLEE